MNKVTLGHAHPATPLRMPADCMVGTFLQFKNVVETKSLSGLWEDYQVLIQ